MAHFNSVSENFEKDHCNCAQQVFRSKILGCCSEAWTAPLKPTSPVYRPLRSIIIIPHYFDELNHIKQSFPCPLLDDLFVKATSHQSVAD